MIRLEPGGILQSDGRSPSSAFTNHCSTFRVLVQILPKALLDQKCRLAWADLSFPHRILREDVDASSGISDLVKQLSQASPVLVLNDLQDSLVMILKSHSYEASSGFFTLPSSSANSCFIILPLSIFPADASLVILALAALSSLADSFVAS